MKITFIKKHEFGSNKFKVGKSYEVVNSLAELWIEEGYCEAGSNLPKETEATEETITEIDESVEVEPEEIIEKASKKSKKKNN